jgi:hypothetical protein
MRLEGEIGELATRVEMEDGGWDGNLIVGEGIHLEKGMRLVVEAPGIRRKLRLADRTRIWKLSYKSGRSRFRI